MVNYSMNCLITILGGSILMSTFICRTFRRFSGVSSGGYTAHTGLLSSLVGILLSFVAFSSSQPTSL